LSYLIGSAAPVAILALVAIAEAQTVQNGSEPRATTVEVVMKDKAFQIIQGEQAVSPRGFVLLSGTHGDIRLRNEDIVAHEFVSPILYRVPFQVSGTGTFVEARKQRVCALDQGRRSCFPSRCPIPVRSTSISTRPSGATSTGSTMATGCAERF